jgi:hypothetical protein
MRFIYFYIFLIVLELAALTQKPSAPNTYSISTILGSIVLLVLWIYFWKNSTDLAKPRQRNFMLAALAAYWLGHTVLTLTNNLTLVSVIYSVGHIGSILVFHEDNPIQSFFKSKNYLILSWVAIVPFIFFAYFWSVVPPLLLFVMLIYTLVTMIWFLAAFNRIGFVSKKSELFAIFGVILSMSCSMLYTMELFGNPLPLSYFFIVPMFDMAYYFIAESVLINKK